MIIDMHAHLWEENYIEDRNMILKVLDRFSIDKVFVSTLQKYYPDKEDVKRYNSLTLEFMMMDQRIGGFIYVDPTHDNCIDVIKKGLESSMSAVKLWVSCFFDDFRVNHVAEFCIDNHLPVLTHAFKKSNGQLNYETTAIHVRKMALRYPELKIIMAHLGGNCYDGIRCIEDLDNVYTDISGTIYHADDLDYTVELIGARRILFGTDLPTGCVQCIGQVEAAKLTEAEKKMIYHENIESLLGERI